jgi:hypothetical protein
MDEHSLLSQMLGVSLTGIRDVYIVTMEGEDLVRHELKGHGLEAKDDLYPVVFECNRFALDSLGLDLQDDEFGLDVIYNTDNVEQPTVLFSVPKCSREEVVPGVFGTTVRLAPVLTSTTLDGREFAGAPEAGIYFYAEAEVT